VGLVVTDERSFYWRLSGRRNLRFFAAMHGLHGQEADRRIEETLEAVDMHQDADRWFSLYSTGMRQRLAIARALLHRPRLLFLDEPSRSLDPMATRTLHNLVRGLVADQAVTVFLITHDMAEAEALCQQVAVMHQGQIQAIGHPDILRRQLRPQRHYLIDLSGPVDTLAFPQAVTEITQESTAQGALLRFVAPEKGSAFDQVLNIIRDQDVTIHNIDGTPPSLEDVFEHFTRRQE